jgi:hypothetical protein
MSLPSSESDASHSSRDSGSGRVITGSQKSGSCAPGRDTPPPRSRRNRFLRHEVKEGGAIGERAVVVQDADHGGDLEGELGRQAGLGADQGGRAGRRHCPDRARPRAAACGCFPAQVEAGAEPFRVPRERGKIQHQTVSRDRRFVFSTAALYGG